MRGSLTPTRRSTAAGMFIVVLFAIVERIVDAKAQFRSLAEPWADTGTSTGRLMIAVLGGLANVERDLIRTRTADLLPLLRPCGRLVCPGLMTPVGIDGEVGSLSNKSVLERLRYQRRTAR